MIRAGRGSGQTISGLDFGNQQQLGANELPTITSTAPTTATVGQLFRYDVAAQDSDGDSLTFRLLAAPAGMAIDLDSGTILWVPTADEIGPQSAQVQVDDGRGGSVTQSFTVTAAAAPTNLTITSTPPLLATENAGYSYAVTAADGNGLTPVFALLQAPAGMAMDPNSGLLTWAPTAADVGSHAVIIQTTDSAGSVGYQGYFLKVLGPDLPPTVNSTPPTTATVGALYQYAVQASDGNDAFTFALVNAPAGMTIDPNTGLLNWTPELADVGVHAIDVRLTNDRGAVSDQTFTLTVSPDTQPPTVAVLESVNVASVGQTVGIQVWATDNVAVVSRSLTVNGMSLPLDAAGNAVFTPTAAGLYTLLGTAVDPSGNVGTATTQLRVIDPTDTTPPVVQITGPISNGTVTYLTPITGTVTDPDLEFYTVAYSPSGMNEWTQITQQSAAVTNGTLATFDPTLLQDGPYDIRVTAQDVSGNIYSTQVTVNVTQNAKIGNFHLEYTDLSVPLAGIPITVTRTYDTLQASQSGAFGFGWTLGVDNPNIQETLPPTGPGGFFSAPAFRQGTKIYLTDPAGHRVGFTFEPTVQYTVPSAAGPIAPPFGPIYHPNFVPDPGNFDSLTVPDELLAERSDGSFGLYAFGFNYNPDTFSLTMTDGTVYNYSVTAGLQSAVDLNGNTLTFSPSGIVSSTGQSIQFVRDAMGRITQIIDPAGHAINYGYDGSGNLISETDQVGNTSTYQYLVSPAHYLSAAFDPLGHLSVGASYDAQGRLIGTSNALGQSTSQSYDLTHFTEHVADELGNVTTDVYDDRGNLVTQTDPLGQTTTMAYDASNDLVQTTDPRGDTTQHTYDDRGNVTSTTDALGGVTTFVYNAFNEVTQETDPLGRTISEDYDAHGNLVQFVNAAGVNSSLTYDSSGRRTSSTDNDGFTTRFVYGDSSLPVPTEIINPDGTTRQFVYNDLGEATRIVDELGNAEDFTYDDAGRLLTIRDPLGGTTTYAYLGQYLASVTDPLGHSTQYVHDIAGRLTEEIDAAGGITQYAYNADGQLVSTTDALGHTTTKSYDADGHLSAVVDALGGVTTYQYDAAGNQIAVINANGNESTYVYDADNRLVEKHDCDCVIETYAYDAAGNMVRSTDKNGNSTSFAYDALNQLVLETNALGGTTAWTYDPAGHLTSFTDPDGHTTLYVYNSRGWLVSETNAAGGVTQYGYDAAGNQTAVTDALGQTTYFSFDPLGRLLTTVDALGGISSDTYDLAGNLTASTDALGNTTHYAYDALNRLVDTTDPTGASTTSAYDAVGNLTVYVDQLGNTTHNSYDALGRLVATVDPLGNRTSYGYDGVGNLTSETDPLGRTTLYAYDDLNRLVQTTDPNGGLTAYTYDNNGNQTSVTDPDGNTTAFAYDALNRLVLQTDPLGHSTVYGYDAAGNETSVLDRDGRLRTFTFDALNQETQEQWWSGGSAIRTISFAYDANGNLIAASDPDSSYTFTCDALNQQLTADNAGTSGAPHVILTSAYDAVGNRTSVQDNSGVTVDSTYNALDQLFSRSWSGGGIDPARADFGYDANGNLTQINRFGDLAATQLVARTLQQYDANGQVTHIDDRNSLDQVFASYDYTLDPAGQLAQEIVNGQTTTYQYDKNGQLTQATSSAQPNEGYAYDANGNRTGGSNVVGPNNQIASDGTFNYVYDNEGNLVTKTEIATGNVTTLAYDYRNRLTDVVTKSSGGILLSDVHYTYDVFDNRIAQTVNGQTLWTAFDGPNPWADYNAAGQAVTRYLYGDAVHQLLARWQPGNGTAWYLTDRLGSVRDLVSSTGALLDRIAYNTYGLVLSQTNAAFGDRFLFAGQQYDAATGLYYDFGRYYDPVTGRFVSQDPWGFAAGDANLYRYVGNGPTDGVDPWGTQSFIEDRLLNPLSAVGAGFVGGLCGYIGGYVRGLYESGGDPVFATKLAAERAVVGAAIGSLIGYVGSSYPTVHGQRVSNLIQG